MVFIQWWRFTGSDMASVSDREPFGRRPGAAWSAHLGPTRHGRYEALSCVGSGDGTQYLALLDFLKGTGVNRISVQCSSRPNFLVAS